MKKYRGLAIVALVLTVLFSGLTYYENSKVGAYDEFAQCLTQSGLRMYGAHWCGHCLEQKAMFGTSWKHVDYIECSTSGRQQTQECKDAGVSSYPQWELSDGSRRPGKLTFDLLSELSQCPLPEIL